MLNKNQLINHWKRWMNRNKSFSKPEMEELESHLWEEMDEMVATDGCSEEEAFHRVITNIGSRKALGGEYKKINKFSFLRINSWIHDYSWVIITSLILIFSLILLDYIYAIRHFTEKMEIKQSSIAELDMIKGQKGISFYEPLFSGYQEDGFEISGITPLFKGVIKLHPAFLYFVYDNEDNIWISPTKIFNHKTKKYRINPLKSIVEHEYTYGYIGLNQDEISEKNRNKNSTPGQKESKKNKTNKNTFYSIGANLSDYRISVKFNDESFLRTFVLFYDEKFQIIYSQKKYHSLILEGETEEGVIIVYPVDDYVFFSDPDKSSYSLYEDENESFLIKMELFEILSKKTNSYSTFKNGKKVFVQNTTVEEKRYELHWSLLKNVKEPIYLHQAILSFIQQLFVLPPIFVPTSLLVNSK